VTTLVDANVLLDVITEDKRWMSWSADALTEAAARGDLAINPIVYAEVSLGYDTIEALDAALSGFTRLPLPYEAGFLAARCYLRYRKRGGAHRSPLPDFYVGAHAAIAGDELLTRDEAATEATSPLWASSLPNPSADRHAGGVQGEAVNRRGGRAGRHGRRPLGPSARRR
jgi:predicted nucleic acid-binding protein